MNTRTRHHQRSMNNRKKQNSNTDWEGVIVIDQESVDSQRNIMENISIQHQRRPSLSRDRDYHVNKVQYVGHVFLNKSKENSINRSPRSRMDFSAPVCSSFAIIQTNLNACYALGEKLSSFQCHSRVIKSGIRSQIPDLMMKCTIFSQQLHKTWKKILVVEERPAYW